MRLTFRMLLKLLRQRHLRSYPQEKYLSMIWFRVTWGDCVWRLMGNDRYHAIMDIGRMDLLLRHMRLRDFIDHRVRPFVYTVDIQYRKPLPFSRKYQLYTVLSGWDAQYFWLEHFFILNGEIAVAAISKNGLHCPAGIVPPVDVMADLALDFNMDRYMARAQPVVNGVHNYVKRRSRRFAKTLKAKPN